MRDLIYNVWIKYFSHWKEFNCAVPADNGIAIFVSKKLVTVFIAGVRRCVAWRQKTHFGKHDLNS